MVTARHPLPAERRHRTSLQHGTSHVDNLQANSGGDTGPGLASCARQSAGWPVAQPSGAGAQPKTRRLFTKRFIFSMIVLANSTALVYFGKLAGQEYVWLCAIVIAGHKAADIVSAWRGNK